MAEAKQGLSLELQGSSALNSDDIPEVGAIEALTDAVVVLFQNIDKQLARYLQTYDEAEKADLHKSMQRFLGRINSNPLIPLSFRLKVLHTFSKEISFLDVQLTQSILNAYKVAILLVRDAAENRTEFLLVLARLCGEAITLAMRVTRLNFENYLEPGIQITRQVHELTRLGLAAIGSAQGGEAKGRKLRMVIHEGLAWYEIMRISNFYGLTPEGQNIVYTSLKPYIKHITSEYCQGQEKVHSQPKHVYLVSAVGGRQNRPQWMTELEVTANTDRVILDITSLLPVLKRQLNDVEEHLKNHKRQQEEIRTEKELYMTHTVTKHLMTSLHKVKRKHERESVKKGNVTLVGSFNIGLQLPQDSTRIPILPASHKGENTIASNWQAFNISPSGVALQTDEILNMPNVTSLVRLVWTNDKGEAKPQWGEVRWRRHLAFGNRRHLGIRFLPRNLSIWRIQVVGGDSDKQHMVLGMPLKKENRLVVWSNNTQLGIGSVLLIEISRQLYTCKVMGIVQRGDNFVTCHLRASRVDGK
ncbi:MAG: hypothetical protein Q9M28_06150 [Mariprofundaceae bacterium]|nr:hypothetical protein [Mariprofundaceae bacterium]